MALVFYFLKTVLPSDIGLPYTGDRASPFLGLDWAEGCMDSILQGDSSVLPVAAVLQYHL